MKKYLSLFLCAIYILLSPFQFLTAWADSPTATYAYIASEGVYFHASESNSSKLFSLPRSYYVKVEERGETYTKVSYQQDSRQTKQLTGSCRTSELTFVDYTPMNPYLYATFEVIYKAEEGEKDDEVLDKLTFNCVYYGEYYIGNKKYAYVLRENDFAYVPYPNDFWYTQNDEHTEWLATQSKAELTGENATPIQIGVLVVLCLLVPILTGMIIKTTKDPTYDLSDDI